MARRKLITGLLSGLVLSPAATWRRADNAIFSVGVGIAILLLIGMVGMTSEAWARSRQKLEEVVQLGAKSPYKSHFMHGSKMHYLEEGKGGPILLIHGNFSSFYMWRNVIPYLKPHGRVIAVDFIGFGKSAKPDIAYRFVEHYRYLEGVIELKRRNVTLVLHDWGSGAWLLQSVRASRQCEGNRLLRSLVDAAPQAGIMAKGSQATLFVPIALLQLVDRPAEIAMGIAEWIRRRTVVPAD